MGRSDPFFELDGVRWDRVKTLGKGSFGEAILVRRAGGSSRLPELAVCKRVVLTNMKPDERKEAVNEVNVLKRLQHPNIVEYIGSFEKDDTLHIFMEYANAGDIEALIKSTRTNGGSLFDEDLVASLVLQMASAIKYLHSRRILHRDLKAQNVFLARRRPGGPLVVKLGDFGISTVLRNTHALAKTVCGTPYYFSPELCLNKPYNSKTDIWSLGCILYEMCTLRHAFDAQNMKALVARILKGNYTPISGRYSPDLSKLIDMMLQQKADRRLDIDGVLGSAWMRRHAASLCTNDLMKTITMNIRIPGLEQQPSSSSSSAPAAAPGRGGGAGSSAAVTPPPPSSSAAPHPAKPVVPERVSSAPRRAGPPAGSGAVAAAEARRIGGGPSDDGQRRQQLAAERRIALERMEQERRRAIEDRRREKDRRMKQRQQDQVVARRGQLEDLDEIRKRMELQTYEEQQRYVERGWDELERVGNVQDQRERQAQQREQHLDMLKQQMAEIEGKMKARREERVRDPHQAPPAPAPAGGRPSAAGPAGAQPAGAAPPASGQQQQQQQQQYACLEPMRPTRPEQLDQFDVDAILATKRSSAPQAAADAPPPAPMDPAMAMWEADQRRFEAARAAAPKAPTAAELAWQKQHERIQEARARQYDEAAEQRRRREAAKPAGVDVRSPVDEVPLYPQYVVGADANNDSEFDNVVAFINEVQDMTDGADDGAAVADAPVEPAAQGPDGDEQFAEAALPANDLSRLANTVKFTLDGKTLHLKGASANDPLTHRVEALRVFLTEALGGDQAFEDLHQSLEYIQNCDADDDEADKMLVELEAAYGPRAKFVDLMVQYMVCVSMLG